MPRLEGRFQLQSILVSMVFSFLNVTFFLNVHYLCIVLIFNIYAFETSICIQWDSLKPLHIIIFK